jgi:cytochrome o ubiquinol oxidase operon protein cyoD
MEKHEGFAQDLRTYLTGFGLALVLTLVPFGLVAFGDLSVRNALIFVGVCGFVQVIVHFRFFLHIDFSRQKREDLQLILFALLLLTFMAGGTIWVIANLATRMH